MLIKTEHGVKDCVEDSLVYRNIQLLRKSLLLMCDLRNIKLL